MKDAETALEFIGDLEASISAAPLHECAMNLFRGAALITTGQPAAEPLLTAIDACTDARDKALPKGYSPAPLRSRPADSRLVDGSGVAPDLGEDNMGVVASETMPSGTVTFLFTDVEGSTALWDLGPIEMRSALRRHDEIIRRAVGEKGGLVFAMAGDGFAAAFERATDAVGAAVDAQEQLVAEAWPAATPLRVRMGLHTGETEERDGTYLGTAVNLAARLMALAHGGQIVCSQETAGLVRDLISVRSLGIHVLRGLSTAEYVFQVGDGVFPPLRSVASPAGNVGRPAMSLVGRDAEVASLADEVRRTRLVTLTGAGGVGKTRLALEVAASMAVEFPDGVWFVDLSVVGDHEQVAAMALSTIGGVPRDGLSVEASLTELCRYQTMLVVLDNCEHVLDGVASVVSALWAADGVSILATSREAIAVEGEVLRPVRPLSVTAEGTTPSDAVRLFEERARAVLSDFSIDASNKGDVDALCRHLDGIPLAIELAAARVSVLSPADIGARLGERFRLLSAGRRRAVERHQTLRAAVDWSYHLLNGQEQAVFCRLSVFVGGCTAPAAEAVLGADTLDRWDVLDAIESLIHKSMVVRAVGATGEARYSMLETLRQYANDRLPEAGDIDALRRAHARWYRGFAEQAGDGLRGPDEPRWLRLVGEERENLRAAVDWSLTDGDVDAALAIPACLGFELTNPLLGLRDLAAAPLDAPGAEQSPFFAKAAGLHAMNLSVAGGHDASIAVATRGRAAEGAATAPTVEPHLLPIISLVWCGRYDEAATLAGQALERAQKLGDDYTLAFTYTSVAAIMTAINRPDGALEMAEEGLQLARTLRNPTLLSMALFSAGYSHLPTDSGQAIALFQEGVELNDATHETWVLAHLLNNLAWTQLEHDTPAAAVATLRRAVAFSHRQGDRATLEVALEVAANVFHRTGQAREAAVVLGAIDSGLIGRRGITAGPEAHLMPTAVRGAQAALGEADFKEANAAGAAMSYDELLAFVRQALDSIAE